MRQREEDKTAPMTLLDYVRTFSHDCFVLPSNRLNTSRNAERLQPGEIEAKSDAALTKNTERGSTRAGRDRFDLLARLHAAIVSLVNASACSASVFCCGHLDSSF